MQWIPAVLLSVAIAAQDKLQLEFVRSIGSSRGNVMASAFSPDGEVLALGGELGDLVVLQMPSQKELWRARPSDHWIGQLSFSDDGSQLACCGRHLTIHDIATGKVVRREENHGPRGFVWDWKRPRFRHGGVVVREGVRVEFELPNKGPLRRGADKYEVPGAVFAAAVTVDGESFAVGGQRRQDSWLPVDENATQVVRWWTQAGKESQDLKVEGAIASLAFHPNGGTLLVSTYVGGLALHVAGTQPRRLPGVPGRIEKLSMTPDGTLLAVSDGTWSVHASLGGVPRAMPLAIHIEPGHRGSELIVQEAQRVVALEGRSHTESASIAVRASANYGPRAAAGPGDLLLVKSQFVDPTNGAVAGELPSPQLNSANIAHTKDGRWVGGWVSGVEGNYGALALADPDGKVQHQISCAPVYTVSFSPDGSQIYCGCGSRDAFFRLPPRGQLRVLDAKTLEEQRATPTCVTCWRFLDEKRALACVDGQLQLWDVATLTAVCTIDVGGYCRNFHLSEDRSVLAFSTGREVRVYRLNYTRTR